MIKIGLTGGISSGKSLVARMFAELGAHTIDADALAHQLMLPGQAAYQEIVEKFGKEILDPEGTINRARLAELAFDKRRPRIYELNGILHPGVIEKYESWMEEIRKREPEAIAILEAALLLEAGLRRRFDRIVVVTCKPQQRIDRWARKLGGNLEAARSEVTRRMMAQAPE
jgi:dephospho-CoA kinase